MKMKRHSTDRKKINSTLNSMKRRVCSDYKYFGICNSADDGCCYLRHPMINSSRTLLLYDIYQRLHVDDPAMIQDHFEDFYENLYAKLSKYGEIKDLIVCDYVPECVHMAGHAFVQYQRKKQASIALENLRGSYHDGIPVIVNFSPVKHLRSFLCPEYEKYNTCLMGSRSRSCVLKHIRKTRRAFPIKKNMIRSHLADGGDEYDSPSVHESDHDSCTTK